MVDPVTPVPFQKVHGLVTMDGEPRDLPLVFNVSPKWDTAQEEVIGANSKLSIITLLAVDISVEKYMTDMEMFEKMLYNGVELTSTLQAPTKPKKFAILGQVITKETTGQTTTTTTYTMSIENCMVTENPFDMQSPMKDKVKVICELPSRDFKMKKEVTTT